MAKVTIELRPSERKALQKAAYLDRRKVDAQAAHLVRRELERAGFLEIETPLDTPLEPANAPA
jgi:aspartyl-tRNA synthetase